MGDVEYCDYAKAVEGGICPCCGKKALRVERGIEIGNIFQLGTKYTNTADCVFHLRLICLEIAAQEQYDIAVVVIPLIYDRLA